MMRKLLKRAGSFLLALTVTAGSAAVVVPMTMQSGIEVKAANSERDFFFTENGDGTVNITGYKGKSANVIIPKSIFGEEVVSIHSLGESNSYIESIILPDGVKSIQGKAFSNYSNLKSLFIPNSVTSLGYFICKSCTSLTNVTLPNSLGHQRDNGNYFFEDCTCLKKISYHSGVPRFQPVFLKDVLN